MNPSGKPSNGLHLFEPYSNTDLLVVAPVDCFITGRQSGSLKINICFSQCCTCRQLRNYHQPNSVKSSHVCQYQFVYKFITDVRPSSSAELMVFSSYSRLLAISPNSSWSRSSNNTRRGIQLIERGKRCSYLQRKHIHTSE